MAKLSWGGLGVDREEKRWFGMQGSWQEGLEVPGEESMEKSFWLYGIAWEVENGKGRIVQNGLVTGAEILKVLQLISRIWGLNSGPKRTGAKIRNERSRLTQITRDLRVNRIWGSLIRTHICKSEAGSQGSRRETE